MPIISVRDNENNRWKRNAEKKTNTEKNKGDNSYRKRVRAKWFCCAFKVGFLQLICKASLIFKSDFELALSIILKERDLYGSKHVAVECRCLKKNMRLVILFDMLLNHSFKLTKSFAHIARTTASTSKFIY